jgi:hypothetical protein
MPFSLPWSINYFVSTAINAANSITGTFNSVSLLVNGNTELKSDTVINHLGIKCAPNASYSLDVSGNVNMPATVAVGTVNAGTATFTTFPTCNDGVTIPSNYTIMNKQKSGQYWADKSSGVTNVYGSTNTFNGNTNFNVNLPESTLNPAQASTTATQFLTRQINDARYVDLTTGQSIAGVKTFTTGSTFSQVNMTNAFKVQQAIVITDNFQSVSGSLNLSFNYYDTMVVVPSGSVIPAYPGPTTFIGLPNITSANIGAKFRIMLGGALVGGSYGFEILISNYASTQQIFYNGTKYTVLPINVGASSYVGFPVGYEFVAVNTSQLWAVTDVTWNPQMMTQNPYAWTALQTLNAGLTVGTGGLNVSATQTINFGTNAPTMSGANIGSATIPNAALQSTVTLNNTASTFSAKKTFTGGIDASGTQTILFGTNAPTMSGANIGSGTIGQTQISGGYVDLTNAQTSIAGAKTFTTLPLSTDATAPTGNNLIRKTYADATYNPLGSYTDTVISNLLVNGDFQLPLYVSGTNPIVLVSSSSTTYLANDTFLTAKGFTGWGFKPVPGFTYSAYIQYGTGGTYYLTNFPNSVNQCLILAISGNGNGMKTFSATYTGYTAGVYNLNFWLCGGGFYYNSYFVARVFASGVQVFQSPKINVQGSFPTWQNLQYDMVIPTNSGVYVEFEFQADPTSSAGFYCCMQGVTLTGNNGFKFSNVGATSIIAGSNSLLNSLSIENGLSVQSGGLNVVGSSNFSSSYGTNNIAISNQLGSGSSTNNTNCVAIGNASLGAVTGANNCVVVGANSNGLTNTATPSDLVIVGASCQTGNQSQSAFIGSQIQSNNATGGNNMMGYQIGGTNQGAAGSYNCMIGNQSLQRYNGFNALTPSYNCSVGHLAQQNHADYFNSSVGAFALQFMAGCSGVSTGGGNGTTTQYNSAFGYNAGKTYALLNNCTFLGANSDLGANNLTGSTAVGYGTIVSASSTIQLGSNSETVAISGNFKSGANTITAAQLGYLAGVSTGIVDTASTQTIGGTKTFSTAPVMSGASITSASIPDGALSSNVELLNATQTISGAKTFTGDFLYSNNYKFQSSSTIITAATTLSGNLFRYYYFMMKTAATYAITLPTVTASNVGTEITFKRIGGSGQILGAITGVDANSFPQCIIINGLSVGAASATAQTMVPAGNNFAMIQAMRLQDAGAGTVTNAASSTTITIVTQSSGSLCVGGVIVFAGNTRYITALSTGIGGTGTYTVNAAITSANTGVAYTSSATFGWGVVSIG